MTTHQRITSTNTLLFILDEVLPPLFTNDSASTPFISLQTQQSDGSDSSSVDKDYFEHALCDFFFTPLSSATNTLFVTFWVYPAETLRRRNAWWKHSGPRYEPLRITHWISFDRPSIHRFPMPLPDSTFSNNPASLRRHHGEGPDLSKVVTRGDLYCTGCGGAQLGLAGRIAVDRTCGRFGTRRVTRVAAI